MIATPDASARAEGRASVRDAIARAASSTGVDFSYLFAQAKSESGLDPAAQAGNSSAGGLFQFIDQSWLGVLKKHGAEHGFAWAADAIEHSYGRWRVTDGNLRQAVFALRNDPDASALMAGAYASENASGLQQALGRQPTATDLYMAHFLGLKGATRFLHAADASPDASAAGLFPHAAAANAHIFYAKGGAPRSLADVYAMMSRKLDGAGDTLPVGTGEQSGAHAELASLTTNGTDTAQMLAVRGATDLLRPDPKHAMLAYRLIAAALVG